MPVAYTGEVDESNIKLFGKWSFDGVKCSDISLEVHGPGHGAPV